MGNPELELQQLKRSLDKITGDMNVTQNSIDFVLEELGKHGIKTIKEAEKEYDKLDTEISRVEKKLGVLLSKAGGIINAIQEVTETNTDRERPAAPTRRMPRR